MRINDEIINGHKKINIENQNVINVQPKPYIAIDGSEHPDMAGVYAANERYWQNILIKSNTENQENNISNEEKVAIIAHFKSVIKDISNYTLKYSEWSVYYDNFKMAIYTGAFNPDFIKTFAVLLSTANVMCLSVDQEKNYHEKINDLNSIATSLTILDGPKR